MERGGKRHILLTGIPGVGKTTLVKKFVDVLKSKEIPIHGFYTSELRNECNQRIGFDVVDVKEGTKGRLARIGKRNHSARNERQLGQYVVYTEEFECIALGSLKNNEAKVLIIDEIGKMELFSDRFRNEINECFAKSEQAILATIPVTTIPFIETLKKKQSACLITVERNNRDKLLDEIMKKLNV